MEQAASEQPTTKVCQKCHAIIPIAAPFCANCGQQQFAKPRRKMSTKNNVFCAIMFLAAFAIFFGKSPKDNIAPVANKTTEAKVYNLISAAALWQEFDSNEVAASQKYKSREVGIYGQVATIEQSILGAPVITIKLNNGWSGAYCTFPRK